MPAPKLTQDIQARLYHETDARFWAQSGYAPGRTLDPKNPTDAAMIPLWNQIYKKVHAEWAAGKLVTTYDHPIVTGLITEAAHEMAKAADSIGLALATPASDPVTKNAHAADAAAAHAAANAATTKAATYQPPSASLAVAAQAAQQVARNIAATNTAAAQAVADGIRHATAPDASPAAPPPVPAPIHPADALDALQASHAPAAVAAVQAQTPALDAPKPPKSSISTAAIVAGGCIAIVAGAIILDKSGAPDMRKGWR
jgi:hypothetical protein